MDIKNADMCDLYAAMKELVKNGIDDDDVNVFIGIYMSPDAGDRECIQNFGGEPECDTLDIENAMEDKADFDIMLTPRMAKVVTQAHELGCISDLEVYS